MSHEVEENLHDLLLELDVPVSRWMFSVSAIGKIKFSLFGEISPLSH